MLNNFDKNKKDLEEGKLVSRKVNESYFKDGFLYEKEQWFNSNDELIYESNKKILDFSIEQGPTIEIEKDIKPIDYNDKLNKFFVDFFGGSGDKDNKEIYSYKYDIKTNTFFGKMDHLSSLEEELDTALENEDFERANELKNEINELKNKKNG